MTINSNQQILRIKCFLSPGHRWGKGVRTGPDCLQKMEEGPSKMEEGLELEKRRQPASGKRPREIYRLASLVSDSGCPSGYVVTPRG